MKAERLAAALAAASLAAFPCAAAVFLRSGGRAAAAPAAAEWPFADIPVPGAFSPSFAMETPDGNFSAAAGRVPETPEAAASRLRAALAAGGWTPAAPTGRFDGASFWTRGRFVALASATPSAEGGGSVWLVVRRRAMR